MARDRLHAAVEDGETVGRCAPGGRGGRRPAAAAILAIAAAAALLAYIHHAIFRTMQCYDDEGYMLIQIWHFSRGWPLYDEIITFYGPMYYLATSMAFGLLPFGHDGVRLLTVGSAGIAAALCGLSVLGITRRPSLAVIAGLSTGLKLAIPFAKEPGHPQIVVAVLVAAIAAVLAWWDPRRSAAMAAVVGSLVAALAMTKINIGAFALLSTALAILLAGGDLGRRARLLRNGLTLAMLLMPLVLIRSNLGTRLGIDQAFFYLSPVAAVLLTVRDRPYPGPRPGNRVSPIAWYVLAGTAVSVALGLFAMSHGTTAYGLVSGIILMPLRMARVWGEGPYIGPARWEALASLTLAFTYAYRARLGRPIPAVATAILKILFAASVLGPPLGITPGRILNGWGLFLWVFLVELPPVDVETEREREAGAIDLPRISLALLAVLQPLQSYPIAGSQIPVGTMLMIPAAVIALSDVGEWLGRRGVAMAIPRRLGPVAAIAIIAMVAVWASRERSAYNRSVPLSLPGSSRIRLPERQVAGIRWLVANINHSSSTFLCTTGFHSLYLWAGVEPPSRLPLAHELDIYTNAQQEALLARIEATPRPLIIDHASFFRRSKDRILAPGRRSALRDGIERDFVPYGGGTVEGFTLEVERGQPLPDVVECARWAGAGPISSATLDLLPKPGHAADRFCIVDLGGKSIGRTASDTMPDRVLADSRADGLAAALELLDESGGRPSWPLNLADRRRLTLKFPPLSGRSDRRLTVVRLIDRDGRLIASVPFVTPFRTGATATGSIGPGREEVGIR